MQTQESVRLRGFNGGVQQTPQARPVAVQDTFEHAPVTQFRACRDGAEVMALLAQTFDEGVQEIKETAARQPTTADLTAAKACGGRRTKHNVDLATCGFTHAVRKARRGRQDGRLGQVAAGTGLAALSVVGIAGLVASYVGILWFFMGAEPIDFEKRSPAGTLKFLVSRELGNLERDLWKLTKDLDDSFVTGELSPALCLKTVAKMRSQLPDLQQYLAQHPEPRVARSQRLSRQLDAIDRQLAKVERKARRRM